MEENNNEKVVSNKKIVPSYANKNNERKEKKTKRRKSKIWWLILALIVIIAVIILIINLVTGFKAKKYDIYISDMDTYGFSRMYDNERAYSNEKVSFLEAIKVLVASALNTYEVPQSEGVEKDSNINWLNYAKNLKVNFNVEAKDYDKNISYMECMNYLAEIKKTILKKDLDVNIQPSFKDFHEYTNEEQIVIKDMVYNKIIEDSTDALKANKDVIKGQLNELIIKFVEKYNIVTYGNEKIAINEERFPSNMSEYPYISHSVATKVYEMEFYKKNADKFINPANLYADIKDDLDTITLRIERYLNTILNVNYQQIDVEEFGNKLSKSIVTAYVEDVEDYVQFVKDNNIVMTSENKIQYPIVYNDGENLRVRVKIKYNIQSSNTLENVLFGDNVSNNENDKITYKLGEHEEFIDIPLDVSEENYLYIKNGCINDWIAGKVK